MATVKGSKQEQMIVVPRRWWHGLRGRLSIAFGFLLVVALMFWAGAVHEAGNGSTFELIQTLVTARTAEHSETISTLKEQLIKAEQEANVDRLAMQDLRGNIQRLRQQISQLEEDVLFYRKIADTGSRDQGLVISAVNLLATQAPDRFRYKIRFEKAGNANAAVEGSVNIAVTGVKDNMTLTLSLSDLSGASQADGIKLRFRSFQDVEGEITIPYGFEPSRIEILAVTEMPESKTLQRNFSWLVESGRQSTTK